MKLNSAVVSITNFFTKSEKSESEQFSDLYNRYQKLVRSVIFQIAGPSHLGDLVQETFIRVWEKLPEFRRESEVSSWIYRIAVNISLDHLRSEKRHPTSSDKILEFKADGSDIEQTLSNRELVSESLMALSVEHRTVTVLSLIHELSLSEIAKVLEISEGTVKSRLHYAREHLKQHVSELSEKKRSL
jgi:RNA polymerase sigma-70 factor (ECF subfamily)